MNTATGSNPTKTYPFDIADESVAVNAGVLCEQLLVALDELRPHVHPDDIVLRAAIEQASDRVWSLDVWLLER